MLFVLVSVYLSVSLSTFFSFAFFLNRVIMMMAIIIKRPHLKTRRCRFCPSPGPFTLGQVTGWTGNAKALCPNAKWPRDEWSVRFRRGRWLFETQCTRSLFYCHGVLVESLTSLSGLFLFSSSLKDFFKLLAPCSHLFSLSVGHLGSISAFFLSS